MKISSGRRRRAIYGQQVADDDFGQEVGPLNEWTAARRGAAEVAENI